MNSLGKQLLLAAVFTCIASTAQAGKVDPMTCPCYPTVEALLASSSCTSDWRLRRFGMGKNGWSKLLRWDEGDLCSSYRLSKASNEVWVFNGAASGTSVCDMTEATVECRHPGLDDAQFKACEVLLRLSKREVQRLDDCP